MSMRVIILFLGLVLLLSACSSNEGVTGKSVLSSTFFEKDFSCDYIDEERNLVVVHHLGDSLRVDKGAESFLFDGKEAYFWNRQEKYGIQMIPEKENTAFVFLNDIQNQVPKARCETFTSDRDLFSVPSDVDFLFAEKIEDIVTL